MATRKKRTVKKDAARDDGYVNTLTGVGDWQQDKMFAGRQLGAPFAVIPIYNRDAEDRWRGSDLGARLVECIPDEMTREWIELTIQPHEEEVEEGEEGETETEVEEEGESEPAPTAEMDAFPPQGGGMPIVPAPKKPPGVLPESDDEGPRICQSLMSKLDELDARKAIWTALCYERAYGGAAILIGAQDGKDPSQPLNEDLISSVDWLNVFSGGKDGEITAWSYYVDMKSPKFGQPETYVIRNIGMPVSSSLPIAGQPIPMTGPAKTYETQFLVHESRLLIFPGNSVSRRARYENRGWGDSVFTRVDEVLSQYNQTWSGVATLMSEFSQAVLKVPGLSAALAGRNTAAGNRPITARAQAIQQTRSLVRMLFIDEKEEFARDTATVTGIADVLEAFALRLAAAADMPVTLLMGQSPAGMSATGESDIRFFYDRVAAKQKLRLVPQLRRLACLLMRAKDGPTEGEEPEDWQLKCCPLYQMSEKEQADLRYVVAQTDAIYIDKQVLSPEEVAASAYGGAEWTMERAIDADGREEMAAKSEEDAQKAAELREEMVKNGPPQPPQPPGQEPPPGKPPVEPVKEDNLDRLTQFADALKTMREAGAVVDEARLKEQFPDLPVERLIKDEP